MGANLTLIPLSNIFQITGQISESPITLVSILYSLVVSSPIWGTALFVLYLYFRHPREFRLAISYIYKLGSTANKSLERKHVAGDIQVRLNDSRDKLNNSIGHELIPYEAKIQWEKVTDREAFVEKNNVVILMKHHKNQAKNFAKATMLYVTHGVIPTARQYLAENTKTAIDLTIAKKIIMEQKPDAMQTFMDDYFEPEVKIKPEIKPLTSMFTNLDTQGVFTRVLLRELIKLGFALYPNLPSEKVLKETEEFLKFFERVANKQPKEKIPLYFTSEHVNMDIMYVASQETFEAVGIDAHIKRIDSLLPKVKTIYLCAWGSNVSLAKLLKEKYAIDTRIKTITEDEFFTNLGRAIIVAFDIAR